VYLLTYLQTVLGGAVGPFLDLLPSAVWHCLSLPLIWMLNPPPSSKIPPPHFQLPCDGTGCIVMGAVVVLFDHSSDAGCKTTKTVSIKLVSRFAFCHFQIESR